MTWETDPSKKPKNNHVSRIVNTSCGSQKGFWTGFYWESDAYEDSEGCLTSDRLEITSWLKTPEDEE